MREAFKSALSSEPDVLIIGQTSSCDDALRIISEQRPDVLIVSFIKPNISGPDLVRKARQIDPSIKILAFVVGKLVEIQRALLGLQVEGLLRWDCQLDEIRLALRRVYEDGTYISQQIADALLDESDVYKEIKLSVRQLQVLKMIAEGFTNKRISAELGISYDTVKTHVRVILKKLDAADRAQAVSKAYDLDMLSLSDEPDSDTIGCLY
ncbi:MAG: response regulator transcription factor [Solirubrobacter sp.]|nr:response regulator transcription factor [Candidatus Aquicultor secundus]NCO66134.1 response regulator transcription factor [Solirubrobacter sp.]